MAKSKSIGELVADLQQENESLLRLKKLFDKACKDEFGYDPKKIHDIINSYETQKNKVRNEIEKSA